MNSSRGMAGTLSVYVVLVGVVAGVGGPGRCGSVALAHDERVRVRVREGEQRG